MSEATLTIEFVRAVPDGTGGTTQVPWVGSAAWTPPINAPVTYEPGGQLEFPYTLTPDAVANNDLSEATWIGEGAKLQSVADGKVIVTFAPDAAGTIKGSIRIVVGDA